MDSCILLLLTIGRDSCCCSVAGDTHALVTSVSDAGEGKGEGEGKDTGSMLSGLVVKTESWGLVTKLGEVVVVPTVLGSWWSRDPDNDREK